MSRVASNPITIPSGVHVTIEGQLVVVKGPKGSQELTLHKNVEICQADDMLTFKEHAEKVKPRRHGGELRKAGDALSGTSRALVNNMVKGVSVGFEKKLTLIGVGYRAQVKGSDLDLTLGFSHPVLYPIPVGITMTTPIPTEVIVSGIDKQKVRQVAAEIRAYRSPEPYKGKGVRYFDEEVVLKETKK